jgi:hypothetical protein
VKKYSPVGQIRIHEYLRDDKYAYAAHVRIEHHLLVLDAGVAGVVTGSKRRWRELLPQ